MFLAIVLSLLITFSQDKPTSPCSQIDIKNSFITWGHGKASHPRKIVAIIIHSSYNALTSDSFDMNGILDEYRRINVSPHYIIDRSGVIYRLVSDQEIAYHAGKSRLPDGTSDVNKVSIGIEIINSKNSSPAEEQYNSLANLVRCLEKEYRIRYVLGHSTIAPGRKTDPWNFDWKKFGELLK
ncbi:MAG TPA: N-acetylmuramoyl-L-alanine amidase [Candidatus Acidoferrales bacterium]|nr:N-acetylmuramoyl-L-alanine amidase [Candidatus Acidoferrales bacterium]